MTSFKLSIPQVGITCDYSFSPIPIRDRESRKAKAPKEYIIVPMRKSNIVIEGVNVYNHQGEELLDRLQLSVSVLQPLLDPFHVEEIHKNALHMMTILSIPKLKAKISNTDYCQLVDVLYKNLSTLDEDLYLNQQNSNLKNEEYIYSPAAKQNAVQYYYGQSEVVFPFAQGCEIYFGFISLNLVDSSDREELVGLFLMEQATYNLVLDARHMLTSFSALSLQALNSWPYTIIDMIQFFSLENSEDGSEEGKKWMQAKKQLAKQSNH